MAVGKHCTLWSLFPTSRQRPCSSSITDMASIQGDMTMVGQHALLPAAKAWPYKGCEVEPTS